MFRTSSILDYSNKELSGDIWKNDNTLKDGIKSFVYSSVAGFFEEKGFEGYQKYLKDILIGSSLATFFYTKSSDFDIKLIIDIDSFRHSNKKYFSKSEEDILDLLVEEGRDSFWLTQMIPGTLHQLDAYFYSTDEIKNVNLLKYDSLYSIFKSYWIKPPEEIPGEVSSAYVLNYAKDKAKQYLDKVVSDIEQTKRDSIDFLMLRDYMKTLSEEDLHTLYTDFEIFLQRINQDVGELIEDKNLLTDLRHEVFSKPELKNNLEKLMHSINYSDANLVFKLMQRYGYMRILAEIKKMFKDNTITQDQVPDVLEELQQ